MKEYYTLLEISKLIKKSEKTVRNRVKEFGFEPIKKQGTKALFFNKEQTEKILTFKAPFTFNACPEIIYVTRQTEVYHSISNLYTHKKIEQIMREFGN